MFNTTLTITEESIRNTLNEFTKDLAESISISNGIDHRISCDITMKEAFAESNIRNVNGKLQHMEDEIQALPYIRQANVYLTSNKEIHVYMVFNVDINLTKSI